VTTIKDSTSGFFAFRKDIIDGIKLEGKSWKIMLEIMVKAKPIRAREVPITFKVRQKGKSKFNRKQVVVYLKHIASLCIYKYNRFLKFCMVGGTGSLITFGITYALTEYAHLWYILSLVFAVLVATTSNFILNSIWTFSVGKSMTDPDYEWRAYYKGNYLQRWWKRSITQKVLELLPEKRNELNILDIGCGSSPLAVEIGSSNYIGIDDNRKKIDFMKKKSLPCIYEHTSTYRNGHKSDVVMAIEVIEHCLDHNDANSFIKTIVDSVKDEGMVIIATPDYSTKMWRFIEKVYGILMPSAYADDHRVKFSEQSLVGECGKYGLKHIDTKRVLGCDMVCSFTKRNS
jgi:predicted SAM-dependent methyltransferase